MDRDLLEATAAALVASGKGILAADESNGTMTNRLEAVGLPSSEEDRRAYRANLFATRGCENAISGVILYDETIRQSFDPVRGISIPAYLQSRGIIPGIKVDTGAKDLAGHPGEKITEGLDDLRARCKEYFKMGARFAKWRAVIAIGDSMPSDACISTNAHALARYAAICQEQGLVPIIEPEVLMDGVHEASTCWSVTCKVLRKTFEECEVQGVHLPGALLKPNMVINGKESTAPPFYPKNKENPRQDVAEFTVKCLTENVPHDLGGIVFLSGGQSDEDATAHLNLMNAMNVDHPWELSYSYGRALQAAALKAWAVDGSEASQAAFAHRAKMNSLARSGDWDISLES